MSAGEGSTSPSVRVVPLRHYGRWVAAVVVVGLAAMLAQSLWSNPNIDHHIVRHYLFQRHVLDGLRNTVILTVVAMVVGVALGVPLATMRRSPNPVLRTVAWAYVWFFRGTPLLVQIIFWGYFSVLFQHLALGVPYTHVWLVSASTNDVMTTFVASAVALSLNEAAYMAEIVRAGILAVDEGQTEAAAALGMTRFQVLRHVVLPQSARVILPPTGNELQNMIKSTSLVAFIAGHDLLSNASDIYSNNLKTIELLTVTVFWYLVLSSIAMIGQYYLERHFATGSTRAQVPTPFQRFRATVGRWR